MALVDVTCYIRINSPITPVFIQLVEQTNKQEATEALSSYLSFSLLFSKLGILILIIIANIIVSRHKLNIPQSTPLSGAIILCAVTICGFMSKTDIEYKYYRIVCQYDEIKTLQTKDLIPKAYYYIPIHRLIYSISENVRLNHTIKELANSVNKASVTSCSHLSPNIVLIIGESLNRFHSSLYRYSYPTTPNQLTREKKGELIKFKDAISSWNVTCESFENMLSTWSEGEKGEWYIYSLFPELFRKAGYHVTFISNQYVQNPATSYSEFKEDIFLNNEKISNAYFDKRNRNLHQYDEGLIEDFKRLEKSNNKTTYNLTIFHFKGVHANFKDRYPEKFKFFSIKDYANRTDLQEKDKGILADYDNAIRYNDYVINKIISLFEDSETIIVYLSDHGERAFDNNKEWGRNLTWNKNDIIHQFCIPMWIWFSKSYKEKHKNIIKQTDNAANKRYMTDNLPQLLLHIAGIKCKFYNPANDILSPLYNENRKRIIRHEKDFDKIIGH